MADGTPIIGRFLNILNNDSELLAFIDINGFAKPSRFSPVGNIYPQVTVWVDEGESEPVFPAGKYAVEINVWLEKETPEPYKKLSIIGKRINQLFNRKASSLSDIDIDENEGLRVAFSLKDGGDAGYDDKALLWRKFLAFTMTISEDEDFSKNGCPEWI